MQKTDNNNNTIDVSETKMATETLVGLMDQFNTPERITITDVIKEYESEIPVYEVLDTKEGETEPKIPEINFQGSVSLQPESFRMTVQGSFKDGCKTQ